MKIIGSDYDGTLNHNGIDDKKINAIDKWRKAGNIFALISGRGAEDVLNIYNEKQFGCDYLIADNGAVIMKTDGTVVSDVRCDKELIKPLLKLLFENGCPFGSVHAETSFIVCADENVCREGEYTQENMPEAAHFTQISTMLDDFESAEKVTDIIRKNFGDSLNPLQNGRCIDIVREDMNKAKGLYLLMDILGAEYDDVIAVGDNINDEDMIKEFRSYAMENGVDSVKKLADYVTTGITELIEKEMKNIADIDKNFQIKNNIGREDVGFFDVKEKPFKIYGIFFENGKFRRLPESVAKKVNVGVRALHANTAGGRVRFVTDSPYVAISVKMPTVGKMPHFALTGSAGFDLYVKDRYFKTFVPPFKIEEDYESVIDFPTSEKREITINFPLYSDVSELYIGLKEGSFLGEPKPYKYEKPIVFYGSSITQGGCASRPGMAYESIVSRRLDADYLNLGFSGSAKAEEEIAEYIKNLEMSVFVYDYDHNAPTTEHLKETHEKMFKTIRESNPHLPVVMMSRPKYSLTEEEEERFSIIEKTYLNAMGNGDENVYLIDGKTLMRDARDEGTVDSCHPNDLGFASMAKAVGDVLEKIL